MVSLHTLHYMILGHYIHSGVLYRILEMFQICLSPWKGGRFSELCKGLRKPLDGRGFKLLVFPCTISLLKEWEPIFTSFWPCLLSGTLLERGSECFRPLSRAVLLTGKRHIHRASMWNRIHCPEIIIFFCLFVLIQVYRMAGRSSAESCTKVLVKFNYWWWRSSKLRFYVSNHSWKYSSTVSWVSDYA